MTAEPVRTPENMLDIALTYLSDEWSVFPVCVPVVGHSGHCLQHGSCKHPGKMPLIKWGVYQDRLPTKLEVQTWWRHKFEGANIGLATGRTSDVVVVDLDGELAVAEANRRKYDDGPWVRTGRIGGRHLYFRYREDAPTIFSKVGGIDFRGHGGFALLPPSLHHTGARYTWGDAYRRGEPLPDLPRWIDELAATTESGAERGPIDFGRLITDGVGEGQRDQELFRAAAKLRGADVPYDLALWLIERAARACTPPFDLDEARIKVDSAYSRYAPNGLPPARLNGTSVEPVPAVDAWRTLGGLVNKAPDTARQIVEGFLWEGKTHWVYSGPGAGKTLTWLAILMHVAAGRPFCGRAVVQGPVVLIEEDSSDSVISEYVQMLAEIYDFDLDSLPFWVNVQRGIRITDEAGLQLVRSMIANAPERPLVVALDACERIVPSDHFSSKELDPLSRLFAMNQSDGIANLMIDHTRKPGSSIEKPDTIDLLYGGRSKSAISDVMMFFSGAIKSQATVSFPKFRGEEPPPISISFDGSAGFTIKQGRPHLSESERQVMMTITNAFGSDLSRAAIESATGLGSRTIQRSLNKLVELGWVEKSGEGPDTTYTTSGHAHGVFG